MSDKDKITKTKVYCSKCGALINEIELHGKFPEALKNHIICREGCYSEKGLLEKLEPRKDEKEIKICPKCNAYYKGTHTKEDCNYHSGEASGGEKTVLRTDTRGAKNRDKGSSIKTDSKLPKQDWLNDQWPEGELSLIHI